MSESQTLEQRCVHPFYLQMMRCNTLLWAVPYTDLAIVGRAMSDDEVITLLRREWRPRVMGAWFAAGRTSPAVIDALLLSLRTSAGSLTAPPLAAVAVLSAGPGALPALTDYLAEDLRFARGAASIIGAAMELLGEPSPDIAVEEKDRENLLGLMDVARRLAVETGQDGYPPDDGDATGTA